MRKGWTKCALRPSAVTPDGEPPAIDTLPACIRKNVGDTKRGADQGEHSLALVVGVCIVSTIAPIDDLDNPVLQEARRSFRAYYCIAAPEDANPMDKLVLAWDALRQGTQMPREIVPAADRNSLERACDDAERKFVGARERVRACTAFREVGARHQRRIGAVLFELYSPAE